MAEREVGPAAANLTVDRTAPADQVPRRWMLIGRTVKVRAAAQDVDRLARGGDLVHVGHYQCAPAFGGGGAVEQMIRVGDGTRRRDVIRGERTALVVN